MRRKTSFIIISIKEMDRIKCIVLEKPRHLRITSQICYWKYIFVIPLSHTKINQINTLQFPFSFMFLTSHILSPWQRNSGDAAQIFHDTAGWRNLETSMKCLEHMITGTGHKFLPFINQVLRGRERKINR